MRVLPQLSLGQATISAVFVDGAAAFAVLVATPYLIKHLGVGPYGILAAVAVLTSQLGVLQLGIGPAATRRTAESRGLGAVAEQGTTLRAAILLGLLAGALVAAGFAVTAFWIWDRGFEISPGLRREAMRALPAGATVAAVQPLLHALYGFLLGGEQFALHHSLRLVQGLGRVAAVVAVVAAGGGIAAALWAQAAVDGALVLLAGATAGVHRRGASSPGGTFRAARALLAVGIPFAVADVFAALLMDAEKLAIGFARSIEDFTYYVAPFGAVFRLAGFGIAFASVLMPRLAAAGAAGEHHRAAEITHRATRLLVVAMLAVLASMIAVAPELLTFWLGPEFAARAAVPTRILLVAMLANAVVYPAHAAVRARAHPNSLARLYALELPLHLAVVYLCVSIWGVVGAAVAWGVRVTVDAVAQRVLARRALGSSIGPWTEFVVPIVALALLAATFELSGAHIPVAVRVALAGCVPVIGAAWLLTPYDRTVFLNLLHRSGPSVGPEPDDRRLEPGSKTSQAPDHLVNSPAKR